MNALGYQKNTPLHEAALNNKYECCKFLLENGANQSIRNQFGVLASDFVRSMPNFVELFRSNANNQQLSDNSTSSEESLEQSVLNTTRANAVQKKILFGTAMSEVNKSRLKSLADQLKLTVSKEMSNNGNSKPNILSKICDD